MSLNRKPLHQLRRTEQNCAHYEFIPVIRAVPSTIEMTSRVVSAGREHQEVIHG